MAKAKDKKGKKDGDKRRATWILKESARDDILECFRHQSAACLVLGLNAKTGGKIFKLEPVKKDLLKDSVKEFLDFLVEVREGKYPYDSAKHREGDIKKAIKKYTTDGEAVGWSNLAEQIEEE